MSRVIPIGIANDIATGSSSLAWFIEVTRLDGQVVRFTSHDRDVPIGGNTYLSGPGLDVASLVHTAGLAVDNTEITILADDSIITRDDIAAGRWDGARFRLGQVNWKVPADGTIVHATGSLGNLRPKGSAYVAELRDLRQELQQDTTAVLQPTCRYRFCDHRCTLYEGAFTHLMTVTAVADNQEFTASAFSAETFRNFDEGEVRWLTGDNAGLSVKIRQETAGVFELAVPMVYPIQIGDTADVIEGCLHTSDACKSFDNILNFGGEKDKPTMDELVAPAE